MGRADPCHSQFSLLSSVPPLLSRTFSAFRPLLARLLRKSIENFMTAASIFHFVIGFSFFFFCCFLFFRWFFTTQMGILCENWFRYWVFTPPFISVYEFEFVLQPPKPSDRAQVQSKEVRLPDSPPISLDDQDVQIVSSSLCLFFSPFQFNFVFLLYLRFLRKCGKRKVIKQSLVHSYFSSFFLFYFFETLLTLHRNLIFIFYFFSLWLRLVLENLEENSREIKQRRKIEGKESEK